MQKIDQAALKAALAARGISATDQQVTELAADVERETEFKRLVRSVYDNLIDLDVWIARNDPEPDAKRTIVQAWVAEVRDKVPALPAYTPQTTAALKGQS